MKKPGVSFGLMCGALNGLIFMTALQNNWQAHPILRFSGQVTIVILFVFVFLAQYRQKYTIQQGIFSFKDGIRTGLLVSVITSILMSVCYVLYVNYVDTGFVNRLIAQSEVFFREKGKSEKEILRNSDYMRKNLVFTQVTGTLFFTTFIGGIFSLLGAAFLRNTHTDKTN
jgi:hypothetical protein